MYAADQVGTELADDYSSIIRELPAELWVSIFEHLDSWADVLDGALANKCLYKTLRANATKLPRPTADLSIISTAEKSLTYLELVPKCGHIRKRKLFEHDLSIFQFFEIDTLILKGPYETKDLLSIIRGLKIGRQRKIRRILMENIHVEDYSLKRFMEHFVEQQRNCERIHLRNCHFPAFPSKMWPEEEHLLQMESLTQFQLENVGQEIDETLALFSVRALAKLGRDLRHRMRRPTTLILLWSAPLPREAEGKVGQCFLEALGQFIENWLHCSDAPAFHIRVLNCDDNFPAKLAEHCRRLDGVSQMFMRFASRAQFSAIKGKYDPDEAAFELRPAPQTLATANRISALSVARFYKLP